MSFSLLSGCRGTEVQNRKYAEKLYIKTENNSVSVEIIFFQSDEKSSGTGKSLSEALSECSKQSGYDIFTGHTEYAVLNTDTPLEILKEMKKECNIADSCSVIFNSYTDNKDNSLDCTSQIKEHEKKLSVPSVDISSALDEFLSPCETAIIPAYKNKSLSAEIIDLNGNGYFLTDDALMGTGIFHSTVSSARLFDDSESYDIYSVRRNIFVSVCDENKLRITFSLTFKSDEKNIQNLENSIAFYIEKAISETIKKGCDVFNVADLIQQKEYSFYKTNRTNLPDVFKNSIYNVCINGRNYSLDIV